MAGYLRVLRDYYELFLLHNVILIMFKEQQKESYLLKIHTEIFMKMNDLGFASKGEYKWLNVETE